MDGNLFASILDSNKQISQQIGELAADLVVPTISKSLKNWGTTASDYCSTDQPYSVSISDVDERQETFMLVPSKFITYLFTFIRHSDGECHSVGRRYKELSAWYQDMLTANRVRNSEGLQFPGKILSSPDDWLAGERTNKNGEYVKTRKADLEAFFRVLFTNNPDLYDEPSTIRFFELTSFSFDVKRVSQQPNYNCGDDDPPTDDYASSFRSHFLDPTPSSGRLTAGGGAQKKDAVLWEV